MSRLTRGAYEQDAGLGFPATSIHALARGLRVRMADAGLAPRDIAEPGMGYANLLFIATVLAQLDAGHRSRPHHPPGRRTRSASPRTPRHVDTDGQIGRDWFRRNVWLKALNIAQPGFRVTPNHMRHAHASWLLAGGADIQVVKERLGHGSITTTERYLHVYPRMTTPR